MKFGYVSKRSQKLFSFPITLIKRFITTKRKINFIFITLVITFLLYYIFNICFGCKIEEEQLNLIYLEMKEKDPCYYLKNLLNKKDQIKIKWILNRIESYCEDWREINNNHSFNANKKNEKILIIIGLLIYEDSMHFGRNAFNGGPLGELVQWADTITSLYTLGHDVTLIIDRKDLIPLKNRVKEFDSFKLIFVDYIALRILKSLIPDIVRDNKIRCKFRVLDSFGTEAEFNIGLTKCDYCGFQLNLKQYFTMFPHTPDNSFLGFVIRDEQKIVYTNKKNIAVIYAKDHNFLKKYNCDKYIAIIAEYFEVHFTYSSINTDKKNFFYHGVLNPTKYYELLDSAKLFVGIGFPYEGPAPLEAINRGCVYLNPIIDPPINRKNSNFWKGKPTNRCLGSQNSYAENYIGEPYVYTLLMNDENKLRRILSQIKNQNQFPTHLPKEYSYEGMLERVQYYIESQDICIKKNRNENKLIILYGKKGEDCRSVCSNEKFICEPDFFPLINSPLQKINCNNVTLRQKLVLPGTFFMNNKYLPCPQSDPMYYSCAAKLSEVSRICPCRKYEKENIAIY